MKIGIVTIYESITNLGSFLQGYAMKIVLEEMGHEVFFFQKETTLHSIKKCVFKINPKREFLLRCKKASYFYKDVKKLRLIQPNDIEKYGIDILLYGSDEIWNLDNSYFNDELFWGSKQQTVKKIAYAISIGAMSEDTIAKNQEICSSIKDFQEILVRDKRTYEFVHKQIGKESQFVCDPTILAPLNKYIVNCSTPKEPYLLVYTYGVDKPLENRIVHFARENNLKIVSPCFWHLWADCVVECSALEFSGLVANANYVFTSTFHGTIFALLNHKQCCIFPYREKVTDVVARLGETQRLINADCSSKDFEKIMNIPFDTRQFEERIIRIREKSMALLKEALQ